MGGSPKMLSYVRRAARTPLLLWVVVLAVGAGVAYAECEGTWNTYSPPAPSVAPSTVAAGGELAVAGTGLSQATTYSVNLSARATPWGRTIGQLPAPDGTGTSGPGTFLVPLGLVSGTYAVWLAANNGQESSAESEITVNGDAETDDEDLDESLTGDGETTVTEEELRAKREEFERTVRPEYWKKEAQDNPGKYSESDLERMRQGRPPIGSDGHPMELHHKVPLKKGGSNDPSNLEPMTRSRHRLGGNYRANHP